MTDTLTKLTRDGLPVVSEKTFLKVGTKYPIASGDNSPEVRQRIEQENPMIAKIIEIGVGWAPSREAQIYYEMGCQITYELLREQSRCTT